MYKIGKKRNKQQNRNALDKVHTFQMELRNKLMGQIALNTKAEIEEHLLIVKEKPTREKHVSQLLQIKIIQFKKL